MTQSNKILSSDYISPVVTMGNFDGLHLGHKKILSVVKENALKKGADPIVLTFSSHPKNLLKPGSAPPILTTLKEKIKEINNFGIENVIVIDFTKEIADMTAEDFTSEFLIKQLCAKTIIIGYDHAFGKNREGNIEFLNTLSSETGVEIIQVGEKIFGEEEISSTRIRNELIFGRVENIESLLGRRYSIFGSVEKGKGRGRTMGFPTANLFPNDSNKLIPQEGVYAVKIMYDDKLYKGMLNIGKNPTFKHNHRTIEVNIIDFNKDIYEENIEIIFFKKIRDVVTFSSAEELKKQINIDRKNILSYFETINE